MGTIIGDYNVLGTAGNDTNMVIMNPGKLSNPTLYAREKVYFVSKTLGINRLRGPVPVLVFTTEPPPEQKKLEDEQQKVHGELTKLIQKLLKLDAEAQSRVKVILRQFAIPQCSQVFQEANSRGIASAEMLSANHLSSNARIALKAAVDDARLNGCAVKLMYPDNTPAEVLAELQEFVPRGFISLLPFQAGGNQFFVIMSNRWKARPSP